MQENPTAFINQEIDPSKLSLSDNRALSKARASFMSTNSKEMEALLKANKGYTEIADKVLRENGIVVDASDQQGLKKRNEIRTRLLKNFIPEYMESVMAGEGPLFLDSKDPVNYERNRNLLEQKFDNYVKETLEINGYNWDMSGLDEEGLSNAIDQRRDDYGSIINKLRVQDLIRPKDGKMYRDTYRNFLENIGSQPDNYIEVD